MTDADIALLAHEMSGKNIPGIDRSCMSDFQRAAASLLRDIADYSEAPSCARSSGRKAANSSNSHPNPLGNGSGRSGRGSPFLCRATADARYARGGQSWRNQSEQRRARRFSARESKDPKQRPRSGARGRRAQKLLFLGSSCIYPKLAPQPIKEDSLLTGPLEPTNEWYAIAKIAGLKLAAAYRAQFGDDFISAMPTNLYGPGDNFDPETSHALPGMIYKFHQAKRSGAKSVTLWGTGNPRREWLHVDDAAEACLVLLEKYADPAPINIGVGEDLTIKELAELVARGRRLRGRDSMGHAPSRTALRESCLNVAKIKSLGWKPQIDLKSGIRELYQWYTTQGASPG